MNLLPAHDYLRPSYWYDFIMPSCERIRMEFIQRKLALACEGRACCRNHRWGPTCVDFVAGEVGKILCYGLMYQSNATTPSVAGRRLRDYRNVFEACKCRLQFSTRPCK